MRLIEMRLSENGGHRNIESNLKKIPDGWAIIPNNMDTPNFPFGDITVEEINGIMTVTKWTPGVIPEPEPEPEPESEPTTDKILKVFLGVE